jgi:DNA-binding HxlR family transcriptional regulator
MYLEESRYLLDTDGLAQWNVYDAACLTRLVLDRMADKWTALIVGRLALGTRRFGELRRDIGGSSPKVLTQKLRQLERDGMVVRRIYARVPPKVDYALTPLAARWWSWSRVSAYGLRATSRRSRTPNAPMMNDRQAERVTPNEYPAPWGLRGEVYRLDPQMNDVPSTRSQPCHVPLQRLAPREEIGPLRHQ